MKFPIELQPKTRWYGGLGGGQDRRNGAEVGGLEESQRQIKELKRDQRVEREGDEKNKIE